MKKSLFFLATLVAVAVFGASACSYSDEAENRVRNASLARSGPAHLSDDCEMAYYTVSWGCLNESEQQRAAGLLNTVNALTSFEGTPSYVEAFDRRTEVLRLLIDFEALEVLCYMPVVQSMLEEGRWPVSEDDFNHYLLDQLSLIRRWIGDDLSKVDATGTGTAKTIASGGRWIRKHAAPVIEPIKYRHLCPSWM